MSTNAQPTPPKRFTAQRKQEVVLRLLSTAISLPLRRALSSPLLSTLLCHNPWPVNQITCP